MTEQFSELQKHGWRVDAPSHHDSVPGQIQTRHGALPEELMLHLCSFAVCADSSDRSWLVSARNLTEPEAFQYNEFELISLEAAGEDAEWAASVREFWRDHFPVLLSVAGDYQYFALVLRGPNQGSVVYGFEPEFESPSVVAPSLAEFLSQLVRAVQSSSPPYPFSNVLTHHVA